MDRNNQDWDDGTSLSSLASGREWLQLGQMMCLQLCLADWTMHPYMLELSRPVMPRLKDRYWQSTKVSLHVSSAQMVMWKTPGCHIVKSKVIHYSLYQLVVPECVSWQTHVDLCAWASVGEFLNISVFSVNCFLSYKKEKWDVSASGGVEETLKL